MKAVRIRVWIDARQINPNLIADKTAPKNVDELLQKCDHARYFSSCDAVSVY